MCTLSLIHENRNYHINNSIIFLKLFWFIYFHFYKLNFEYDDFILSIYSKSLTSANFCYKLSFYFKIKSNQCRQNCFQIQKYGGFGNQIVSFLRSVQLAKKIGVSLIFFQPGFIMQQQTFLYNGIYFNTTTSKSFKYFTGKCFRHNFFFPIPYLPRISFDIDHSFRLFFRKLLLNISIPNDALVIHLRSGDIFERSKYPSYGQPPCQYYRDVLKMKNWSRVIIVSSSTNNPCVNILCKEVEQKHVPNSFIKDISILLNAPNIVFSRGSFGFAIIALSCKLKNIFMFNISSSRIPNHMNCVPTDEYFDSVIKNWKNTRSQKKKMISSYCKKWEFIPYGSKNLNIFMHEDIF